MDSGHISLFSIFKFIAKHLSGMRWRNTQFRPYSSLCKKLTNSIPEQSGWYFWGRFDKNSKWECIYVGRSKHTEKGWGLHHRIIDEIKEERIAFWAYVVGDKKAFSDQSKAFDRKYDSSAKRALKKKGTHFIIWVSDPTVTLEGVLAEESALVDYYKPLSNIQRVWARHKTRRTKQIIVLADREMKKIIS